MSASLTRVWRCPAVLVCLATPLFGQSAGRPISSTSVVLNLKNPPAAILEPAFQPVGAPQRTTPGGKPTGFVATNFEPPAPLAPHPLSAAPAASSFQALLDNNTVIPPDTMGAVGPNHVVTFLNSQVLIQSRLGTTMSTTSLNSFWSATGASGVFDPHITYDPYTQRWIASAVSGAQSVNSWILAAMSNTNDPTGTWTMAKFAADPSGQLWADYPTIGFTRDWVVITANLFPVSIGNAQGSIYVLNKADLLAGAANIRGTLFTDSSFSFAPAVTFDNTLSTMYLVQVWNGNYQGGGYVRISTITGPVGSETLNANAPYPVFVSTPNPWNDVEGGNNDGFAPQLNSGHLIETDDDRMTAAVYRNGYLWFTHTIFLPAGAPTRSSVQWWQITPTGTIVQRAVMDDSTSGTFYAYPSIAVNKRNDVLIGYSRFSATQYASSDYAFRYGTDPVNTIQADMVFKGGEASYFKTYSGSRNRWGDYSASVVDAADDTTMWSLEEYASIPGGGNDRWGTWWLKVSPVPPAPTVVSVTPLNGIGSQQLFTATYASSSGATDLAETHLYFGSSLSGASACWAYYVYASNSLYLINDGGNGLTAGLIHPGTPGTLSNSQCNISNAGAVTSSGNNLSVPVNITFTPSFGGIKTVWAYTANNEGQNSGWITEGTWTPSAAVAPTVISINPINGSGSPQTFTATYGSLAGASDLAQMHVYFGSGNLTPSGACWILYVSAGNSMYLANDAGNGVVAGVIHPGSPGTLSNSQCTIGNAGLTSSSGNNFALPVSVTFAAGFAGTQDIFALAVSNEGLNSNWVFKGTWMPVKPANPTVVSVSPINGLAASQIFTATYASNAGASDIAEAHLLFSSPGINGVGACWVYYVRSSNSMYLANDAGTGLVSGVIHPGNAGTLSNSECMIGNAGVVTQFGNNLLMPVSVTFLSGFTGVKSVFGFAADNESLLSGWVLEGTWTP